MKFTEEKLEKAFTELLGQEGFSRHLGNTILRKPDEVLIEEVTNIQSIFKMSSFYANKLDKLIIFALQ